MTIGKFLWGKHGIYKLIGDLVISLLSCLLMFKVLPGHAVYYHLSASQSAGDQVFIHTVLAILCILFFRLLTRSYSRTWQGDKYICLLSVIAADVIAGIAYYMVNDYVLVSEYPFMLIFSTFAVICIASVFERIVVMGFIDMMKVTEQ